MRSCDPGLWSCDLEMRSCDLEMRLGDPKISLDGLRAGGNAETDCPVNVKPYCLLFRLTGPDT